MSAGYRLFGAETSAYSNKLRSYLRYKGLEHEWIPRTAKTEEQVWEIAKFRTLPVLTIADKVAVHDTTPMIFALEADSPEPPVTPEDPICAFLAVLLEDYADLWLAKTVAQYRWGRRKDQKVAAIRAIDEYYGEDVPENRKELEKASIETMVDRMPLLGLNKEVGGVVEKSFKRFLKLLNAHLEKSLYIFGGRPSIADFAIAAQIGQMMTDPTPSKIIEKDAPFVRAWVEFVRDPKAGGPFLPFNDLSDTLTPLFKKEVAQTFLPWAAANVEAVLSRADEVHVTLIKDEIKHAPMKSASRSFRDTRRKLSDAEAAEGGEAITEFLESIEALEWLRRGNRNDEESETGDDRSGRRRRGRRRGRRGRT